VTIEKAFPELETHELIEEMIAGRMKSNADLEKWLGKD
jgi:hypothetical protein